MNMTDFVKYYFTSKIEIKPQPNRIHGKIADYYFTSKIEIKPQQYVCEYVSNHNYFTSMNRYHKSADLKTRKIKEGKIWSSTIKNLRNRHCYCQMR